ncbi:MAG: hypothetical protein L0229_01895 [Blastocatellia bacterium]|nr:hypothetical protein [Blastocatellia bacterium]
MRKKLILLIATVLVMGTLMPIGAGTDSLPAKGQQVVDYLLKDWQKQFRSTSIPLAMKNLGMKPDDGLRLKIGEYLRENTDIARNLKFWGANNYILSNEEKLIAKYLINTYETEKRMPGLQESSKALEMSSDKLKDRLAFMARAGLLERSGEGELRYKLAEGYGRWGGPLRYNFHTVEIEGEKPFDVW